MYDVYIYIIYIYIYICVCVTYINTSVNVFLQTYRKQAMPVSLYQLDEIKTSSNRAKK